MKVKIKWRNVKSEASDPYRCHKANTFVQHRWTREHCAKRFMVYEMKDNVETAFSFMSKIYGLLEFEKVVREDEDIPADKKEAKIQKKIKDVAEAFGVSSAAAVAC